MTVPHGDRANRALNSIESGERAEKAVQTVFDLAEPDIEIKSCCYEYYRVVIKSQQLAARRESGKIYCIVLYHRPRRTFDGKRLHTRTLKQAFNDNLTFYFIHAEDLWKIIFDNDIPAKAVRYENYHHVPLRLIREKLGECEERKMKNKKLAFVYGTPPDPLDLVPF